MSKTGKIFLVLIVISLSPFFLSGEGESDPIAISGEASSSEIFIGDQFTYRLRIEWEKGYELLQAEPPLEMGKFELLDVKRQTISKKKGAGGALVYSCVLSTYDTGEFEIPPFTITYRTPSGEEKKAQSQPMTITVKPILQTAEDARDIRDVKSPLTIPAKPYLRNFMIGAGLVILVLVALAWFIRRRISAKRLTAPEEWIPPRPIEELALEELDALENSPLLTEGRIKEYYTRVSEIIRVYLGRRYKIYEIGVTSYELLCALEGKEIERDVFDVLDVFSDTCDLVKFAKFKPGNEVHAAILEKARFIVKQTTPSPLGKDEDSSGASDEASRESEEDKAVFSAAEGGGNP